MADPGKVTFAFIALALAGAGTASAQSCQTLAPVGGTGYVAVEGVAELLPTLQINCDGGNFSTATVTLTAK